MSGSDDPYINYDALLQDALRSLIPAVLGRVALGATPEHGLPGEHHFYIGFATHFPGVHISARLLKEYPQEMVIIIRNRFQNLKILDEHFEVTLFFGGIPETLTVPYKAVKRFEDPSCAFALSFPVDEPVPAENLNTLEAELSGDHQGEDKTGHAKEPDADQADQKAKDTGSKVVSLDQFRKA